VARIGRGRNEDLDVVAIVASLRGMLAGLGMMVLALAPQDLHTAYDDVQYVEGSRHPRRTRLDLFVPKGQKRAPLVMYVHGGSWIGGRKEEFSHVGEALADRGFACAVINTRLFPVARPEAMVDDCARAFGYLHRHANDYGYDGDRMFVMGHSSGAHLGSWLAYDDRKLRLSGVPRRALCGAVLLSGVYDVRTRHIALDGVFGLDTGFRQRATPWLYADEDDCPAYVGWAERELPGVSLCARLMRDQMRLRGVPVQSARYARRDHLDYIHEFGEPGDPVIDAVVRFLEDPRRGVQKATRHLDRAMLWIAADDRERRIGEALARVCGAVGVEVDVRALERPDGNAVTELYRRLRVERRKAGRAPLQFAGGFGDGGLAVATSALTAQADGLAGRVVAGVPLATPSLRAAGHEPQSFACLCKAPVLNLIGDRDTEVLREDAVQCMVQLMRDGCDASPIELMGTKIESALVAMDADNDLLRPILLAFLSAAKGD